MTSASELFSTRRSRPGRSDPVLESDSSFNRHHHHNHHHRRHRHDSNGFARAPPRLRRFCHHIGFSQRSRDVGDFQGVNSSVDLESQSDSLGSLSGSERLPGSVLLARARLFERLRGVSLSDNSRGNRVLLGEDQRESSLNSAVADPNFQPEGLHVSYNKKPQGLSQDAINGLHRQTFSSAEVKTDMRDCSICLESFTKGDTLLSLPCSHSFHSSCLNPWLRACGDCPYCRRAIVKE